MPLSVNEGRAARPGIGEECAFYLRSLGTYLPEQVSGVEVDTLAATNFLSCRGRFVDDWLSCTLRSQQMGASC